MFSEDKLDSIVASMNLEPLLDALCKEAELRKAQIEETIQEDALPEPPKRPRPITVEELAIFYKDYKCYNSVELGYITQALDKYQDGYLVSSMAKYVFGGGKQRSARDLFFHLLEASATNTIEYPTTELDPPPKSPPPSPPESPPSSPAPQGNLKKVLERKRARRGHVVPP